MYIQFGLSMSRAQKETLLNILVRASQSTILRTLGYIFVPPTFFLNFLKKNCLDETLTLLFHCFNNRWRWCCGRFSFKQNTQELGYQRSFFLVRIFVMIIVFIFFHQFRSIKHFCTFTEVHGQSQDNCVGDIVSINSIRSFISLFTSHFKLKIFLLVIGPY